jgi:hypothetical protein
MTNTEYDPQAHASDTEMAIAHLYASAWHIQHEAMSNYDDPKLAQKLPAQFQSQDNLMDALTNLCLTTGSSISIVLDVAKTLR